MSVRECHRYGRPGWKYGIDGYCHLYDLGDKRAYLSAIKKAIRDGHELDSHMDVRPVNRIVSWLRGEL